MPDDKRFPYLDKESRAIYDALSKYLVIDPDNLVQAIAEHGAQYAFLATHHSIVRAERDDAKRSLEAIKADRFIQSKMSSFEDGTGKVTGITDALAKAYTEVDELVMKARDWLGKAEKDLALWDNIMLAMEQKSYMLTKLADLQITERKVEADTFNGETRQDIAKQMDTMANMDAKREMNLKKRQAQLDSIRSSKAKTLHEQEGDYPENLYALENGYA